MKDMHLMKFAPLQTPQHNSPDSSILAGPITTSHYRRLTQVHSKSYPLKNQLSISSRFYQPLPVFSEEREKRFVYDSSMGKTTPPDQ